MESEESIEEETERTLIEPFVIERVRTQNDQYEPVVDIENVVNRSALFKMPQSLEPTASNLSELWISYSLLKELSDRTNKYIISRGINTKWSYQELTTSSDICQFIAIIYYMGIVELPYKDDYWSTDEILPSHPVVNGISRARFRFLLATLTLKDYRKVIKIL